MITSQISFQVLFAVFLNDLEQFMEDKNITGLESISSELEPQLEIYIFLNRPFILFSCQRLLMGYKLY